MAGKRSPDRRRELASLRTCQQENDQKPSRRRRYDAEERARLEAEIARLKTDLDKSQQAYRSITEENARKEKVAANAAPAIAAAVSPPKKVEEPSQLAETAHAARLLMLGELAANLIHEVNQPLCAIGTYAHACLQLVGDAASTEQEVTRLLERIASQAERAGELVRRYRRFASRRQPELAAMDINAVAREALQFIDTELQCHKIETRLHLAENLPTILADPVQIGQVLLNLMRNALEAMAESPAGQRQLTLATRQCDNEIHVAVSDTGIGLSIETVRDLFEAFRTSKPNGMGLGLAISRAIIQAHNGRMWVKPNPQRGTSFFFALLLSKP